MLVIAFLKFIVSAVLLSVSAVFIMRSLLNIAKHFKLDGFTASFILMSAATSLPELSVSVSSALQDTPEITLGAVIGSNIANLTVITGIVALFAREINVKGIIHKRDASYMTYISIVSLLLLADHSLSRADGAILLLVYFYYIWRLFKQRQYFDKKNTNGSTNHLIRSIAVFAVSLAVLLTTADSAVASAQEIAISLSLPIILIGFFVVALGTSLPELVFEITVIREKRRQMALGDLIGSVVTNATLILGIAAIISPINIGNPGIYNVGFIFFIIALMIFNIFMWTKKELNWFEGLILIFIYIAFITSEFFIGIISQ